MEYDHLESTEHHNDEHVVTCSISTAYAYVRTDSYKTWEHTYLLQIVAGEASQVAVPHRQVLGYADCRGLTSVVSEQAGFVPEELFDGLSKTEHPCDEQVALLTLTKR